MSRRHEPPPPMATLMDIRAVLGQGMLILDVTQAAKPVAVNTTTAGWSIRSEIAESQVADFRRSCKSHFASCSLARWLMSVDYEDPVCAASSGKWATATVQVRPPHAMNRSLHFFHSSSKPKCFVTRFVTKNAALVVVRITSIVAASE